jgi:hypothetical protein
MFVPNAATESDDSPPYASKKRTSAAKAVKRTAIYGTAEAVPFVGQSLPRGSFGAVQIAQLKNLIGQVWPNLAANPGYIMKHD